MKAFKLLLVFIGLLVVLVVGLLVYLATNLNSIVKSAVESEGPKLTQTAVTLGAVDIQPRKGRGELTNFVIANPSDYSSRNALVAEELVLQLEPGSVLDDVVVINELLIDGVVVTAEQKGLTTNLQTILQSVQQATASEDTAGEESDLRLMVEKVRFSNSALNLVTEEYGEYSADLPELQLDNLGDRERGLTPAELGKAIIEPLVKQARSTAETRLKELARNKAEDKLKEEAKEKLGDDAEEGIKRLRERLN